MYSVVAAKQNKAKAREEERNQNSFFFIPFERVIKCRTKWSFIVKDNNVH
jgi:hypothetical protein